MFPNQPDCLDMVYLIAEVLLNSEGLQPHATLLNMASGAFMTTLLQSIHSLHPIVWQLAE